MCDSCPLSCRKYLISFHCNSQSLRVPVIVASEAYKFCEKVQLDSVVYNELGSASEIVSHAQGESGAGGVHVNMSCITTSSCDHDEDF
jgi:translation initiation factor 2B subunit (eIF-2B alpha/beta/delta family)